MSGGEAPATARWSARAYGVFVVAVVSAMALLAGAGFVVARLRGDGSLPAVLAAIAVVALASLVGGIPLSYVGGSPPSRLNRALVAMLLRLALVAGLAALCLFAFDLPRRPFAIALLVAYLALLAVDTLFSIRVAGRAPDRL